MSSTHQRSGTAVSAMAASECCHEVLGSAASCVEAFDALCHLNTEHCDADAEDRLTPFHSVAAPPISLPDYIARFIKYLKCTEQAAITGILLACRFCKRDNLQPSRLTAHRLVLAGTVIAVKCYHDYFRPNQEYARTGGIPLDELNALEMIMCHGIDYRTRVEEYELDAATRLAAAAMDSSSAAAACCRSDGRAAHTLLAQLSAVLGSSAAPLNQSDDEFAPALNDTSSALGNSQPARAEVSQDSPRRRCATAGAVADEMACSSSLHSASETSSPLSNLRYDNTSVRVAT